MLESVSRDALKSMYWIFILAGPLVLFTWIRSFRYLAFTSIIGANHLATSEYPYTFR